MGDKQLFRIFVTGRVQGVGYRWSAVYEARRLGIYGYVKNLADGSVYIEAEGAPEQLNKFVEWCRKGPGTGSVKNVVADAFPPVNYREFRVEY
jgi:acylphosphatase